MSLEGGAPTSRLAEIWGEIDRMFERTHAAHPGALACRSGCADCCVAGLVVSPAEAEAVRAFVAALDDDDALRLAALASRPEGLSCVALDEDARCSIYAARPVVCRTFGLPHRVRVAGSAPRRLPLLYEHADRERVVGTCVKNFVAVPLPGRESAVHAAALAGALRSLDGGAAEALPLALVLRAALGSPRGGRAPP